MKNLAFRYRRPLAAFFIACILLSGFQNCTGFDTLQSTESSSSRTQAFSVANLVPGGVSGDAVQDVLVWYEFIGGGVALNPKQPPGAVPVNPPDINVFDAPAGGPYSTWMPLYHPADNPFPVATSASDTELTNAFRQHAYWLSSMGATGIIIDFTNYGCLAMANQSGPYAAASRDLPAVYRALRILLGTFRDLENRNLFPVPKVTVAMRVISVKNFPLDYDGSDTENYAVANCMSQELKQIANEYPQTWFRLNDGTAQASLPFLIAFTNFGPKWRTSGPQWPRAQDPRDFNFRYEGVPLTEIGLTEARSGTLAVKNDFPYWPFHEPRQDGGVFRFRGGRPEAAPAWVAMWNRGKVGDWSNFNFTDFTAWLGMLQPYRGFATTFQSQMQPILAYAPQVTIVNRWNYGVAWRDQPAEGLSIYKSTVIEPSVQLGFAVLDDVSQQVYASRKLAGSAPGAVTPILTSAQEIQVGFSGFTTQLCMVGGQQPVSSCDGPWTMVDMRKLNLTTSRYAFEVPSRLSSATTVTIYAKNAFGVSPGISINKAAGSTSTSPTTTVPASVSRQPAGFFQIGNGGIYFSNGNDAYCGVANWDDFLKLGGRADLSNVTKASTLPTGMRGDPVCAVPPQPAGFFQIGYTGGLYFSNGQDAYCGIPSFGRYLALGGRADLSNVVHLSAFPTGMRGDPQCN